MTTITIDTLADSRAQAQVEPRMESRTTTGRLILSMLLAGTVDGRADVDVVEFVVSAQHRAALVAGLREAADVLEAERV